ncbi:MAG: AbrB/MazE/SpoVT family DNA-binding domain-containing protein [bacterium]|nr:AbrB/MazE/SpoVT family DNA-binding domain-containing protein [bacterium]
MITTMSKGQQITIPSEMRQSLGLKQGSKMEIEIIGKKIVIKPIIEEDLEQLLKEQKNINS